MQYAYEQWDHDALAEEPIPLETTSDAPEAPFSLIDDLKELETRLSLNLEEGLRSYKESQSSKDEVFEDERDQNPANNTPPPLTPLDTEWDEFGNMVANQVLTYLLNNPLQTELSRLRTRMDEYYEDNRSLMQQLQQALQEKESLRQELENAENELSRFHLLIGRFFIKD